MGVELDSRYQTEAYESIQKSIRETGKAGIVLPTGTGKTYLALKLIEDNLDKGQILYISPSPTINAQVRKKIRETYPKEEAEKILSKVKFITYSGLNKRFNDSKFDIREYNSDVIILDEVHRSGAPEWSKAVDYLIENNPNAQVLGMTATPIRSDGQNMIEKRCGSASYELKVSEAVARGILKPPKYISSRYIFKEDIQDLQKKIDSIEDEKTKHELQRKLDKARKSVENAEGLKEILEKHMKAGKWLVFCNPGDNIEELQEQAKKEGWFDAINKNQTFLTVESTRSDSENDMALRAFERNGGEDLRILYSKNMLNEGIHDEEITGEIMLRPTKSYILFTQQLGRILSKDREEEPIVLDLVGNIKHFKEFRLEIQKIIVEGIERGDPRYSEEVLEQFKILEEQEDFIQAFEEIETSIEDYKNRTSIEEALDILEKLQAEGIDVTKIQKWNAKTTRRSTYLYEIQHDNIEEILERLGLDRNYPIGLQISTIIQAYNGTNRRNIAELDMRRIEKLGIVKERSSIEETLDILEALQAEGIDVTKIQRIITENKKQRGTYLYEIQHDNIEEIIEKLGLDRNYPIGNKINQMIGAYKKTHTGKITDTDRERIEQLGFIKEKKSSIEETLDILEALQAKGIDVTKIQMKSTKETGKERSIYLYEIEHENIEEIIKKLGLDRNYPLGFKMSRMLQAYRGTGTGKITDIDRARIEALGLIKEQKSSIEETLDILEALQAEGIDVSKIKRTRVVNGKTRNIYIHEIQNENIEEIIKKLGLDRNYPIGNRINSMLGAYNGKNDMTILEEDRRRIEALGLIKENQTAVEKILVVLEMLQAEGIEIAGIQRNKRENGKMRTTYLYEVVSEEIIEKLKLDKEYPIGKKITQMLSEYKRKRKNNRIR